MLREDDRPGLPNAQEHTITNEPFDEKANTEMIERDAGKKRELRSETANVTLMPKGGDHLRHAMCKG